MKDRPYLNQNEELTPDAQSVQEKLAALAERIANCRACSLHETRTQTVFGSGSSDVRIVIIGEAPGKNEDLSGEPFIGAAGKKLDALLEEAGLRRDEVFIANILKCRPPSNRNPKVEEVKACAPHLRAQLRLIWPDVIICLGNFASQFVLHSEKGVSNLRGQSYKVGHFQVFPTYHPAATIYHPSWREDLLADLKSVKAWLDAHPKEG